MRISRTGIVAALLLVEAGIATLGVVIHYGWSAEYGDIADSALEGLWSGLTAGASGLAVALVAVVALIAAVVSSRPWLRVLTVGIPVLMVASMLAVTPVALRAKLESQYDDTPQCVRSEDSVPGASLDAQRESQRAFDSMSHVGHFSGGGGSGVDGCDRSFVLTRDVDVLEHYRAALDEAGWRVTEDDARHVRAEHGSMAFEVITCTRGGAVWAGENDGGGRARCDEP